MKNGVVTKSILLNKDSQLLILHRSSGNIIRPLQWDIPGGIMEEGESFSSACSREIKEETGIEVPAEQLVLVYGTTDITKFGNVTWLFFLGRQNSDEVTISHEHDEYKWVSLEEAIKLIIYPLQEKLLKYVHANNLLSIT